MGSIGAKGGCSWVGATGGPMGTGQSEVYVHWIEEVLTDFATLSIEVKEIR